MAFLGESTWEWTEADQKRLRTVTVPFRVWCEQEGCGSRAHLRGVALRIQCELGMRASSALQAKPKPCKNISESIDLPYSYAPCPSTFHRTVWHQFFAFFSFPTDMRSKNIFLGPVLNGLSVASFRSDWSTRKALKWQMIGGTGGAERHSKYGRCDLRGWAIPSWMQKI